MYNYENHTGQNEGLPRQTPAASDMRNRMARTAMILSLVSLPLCMTGYLSLIPAGIAMMMAFLSADAAGHTGQYAKIAIAVSAAAIALSIVMILTVVFLYLLPMLRSPEMRAALNESYMEFYGVSFDELWNEMIQGFGSSR